MRANSICFLLAGSLLALTPAFAVSPLDWPSDAEDFEAPAAGSSVETVLSGWSVVDASTPAEYSAEISTSPTAHLNQAPGSTKWLTVTDNNSANDILGRVYSNTIVATGGTVSDYSFSWRMNVNAVQTSTSALLISQHLDGGSAFRNVAGLEVTSAGVNLIIQGSDDGHFGKAGATARALLYSFDDAGGFAKDSWVPLSYNLDFTDGILSASATGTDAITIKTAQIAALALQGTVGRGSFRFCIRNHGVGNVSIISYDELTVNGQLEPSAVEDWRLY